MTKFIIVNARTIGMIKSGFTSTFGKGVGISGFIPGNNIGVEKSDIVTSTKTGLSASYTRLILLLIAGYLRVLSNQKSKE
ncbi:MAG: hypothetical protein JXA82_20200 [Sedimentisphaerales bacterium]|nr:hypothetical protein [Sedimentisphaerales bacterium]